MNSKVTVIKCVLNRNMHKNAFSTWLLRLLLSGVNDLLLREGRGKLTSKERKGKRDRK